MKIKNTQIEVIRLKTSSKKIDNIQHVIRIAAGKYSEEGIRGAVKKSLKTAQRLKINSIAFTILYREQKGLPKLASAKIMAQEVLKYLRQDNVSLKKIIICLYDKEAFAAFKKGIIDYLEYIMHKLQAGPFTTVDAIIEIKGGIVVIKRSNPPFGWALPGGFVDYAESLEEAVTREAKEETGLKLVGLKQFHTYSAPGRDPRFHTIGTVFIAKGKGRPRAGDDAAGLRIIKLNEIKRLDLAFDHKKIIQDYIRHKNKKGPSLVF